MIENKRFGFEMDGNCYKCIADTIDKKLYTDKKQIIDLLNVLYDENEQLKEENEEFNEELMEYDSFKRLYGEKIERLEKENEQLKEENKWLKSIHFASDVLKENKELKQEIETLHEQLAHIGDVFE